MVGDERCPIVDTWWQTETGAHADPLPGATPLKPGSATKPFFGVQPCLLDDQGHEIDGKPAETATWSITSLAKHDADRVQRPQTLLRDLFCDVPKAITSPVTARRD